MTNSQTNFGKVAVLLGGTSAEREISLKSGNEVLAALLRMNIDAVAIDTANEISQLVNGRFDTAFNMLHGRVGEDGCMQGLLECLRIPYTGSGVMASAIAMDKFKTKQIWLNVGLPTPPFRLVTDPKDLAEAGKAVGFPLIVKPLHEGSSIGMSRVDGEDQLQVAWQSAAQYDRHVMLERWVSGTEYTAAILNHRPLPLIQLKTPNVFYDYDAKYVNNTTQYICPCGLDENEERALQEMALLAFDAVGAEGWGRVDFMLDEKGQAFLIEVNTLPGMTDHSLVPMAAKQHGLSFDQLVLEILRTAALKS